MSRRNRKIKGPVNYVQLYRRLDDKNIYIFYDIHANGIDQKCSKGIDLSKYLKSKIFPNLSEKLQIDLFVEQQLFYKMSDSTIEFGESSDDIDSISKMRVLLQKCHKNVRCHYMDVRFELNGSLKDINRQNDVFYESIDELILKDRDDVDIEKLYLMTAKHNESIKELIVSIFDVFDYMYGEKTLKFRESLIQNKLYQKIYDKLEKYDRSPFELNNVKYKKIMEEYNKRKKEYFDRMKVDPDIELSSYIERIDNQEEYNIKKNDMLDGFELTKEIPELNNFDELIDMYISVQSILVDIYTVGRLLKSYMKYVLIYAGVSHCKNIIDILTKDFGFEIIYSSKDVNFPSWNEVYTFHQNFEMYPDLFCCNI